MTINYRDTLNLPVTDFSMKAGLPRKEPEILNMWSDKNIYNKIRKKYEDKDSKWREFVNTKLKKEYKKLFNMIDHFIFMKIPDFKAVFRWRLLQETKLKKKSHSNKKIMSYNILSL